MAKQHNLETEQREHVVISAPNFQVAKFLIRGTAPYVQNKFAQKAVEEMRAKQEAGSTAKKGCKREAKDFQECYLGAQHIAKDGWNGIPAPAFRNAMVDACRACGYKMTHAKLAVFIEPDGFDAGDGMPLVKITKGKPEYYEAPVRIQQTTDVRARPMWREGWEAQVRIKFDADMFTLKDVSNLFMRAGMQVGIGEGRPNSRTSCGLGFGVFEIVE